MAGGLAGPTTVAAVVGFCAVIGLAAAAAAAAQPPGGPPIPLPAVHRPAAGVAEPVTLPPAGAG